MSTFSTARTTASRTLLDVITRAPTPVIFDRHSHVLWQNESSTHIDGSPSSRRPAMAQAMTARLLRVAHLSASPCRPGIQLLWRSLTRLKWSQAWSESRTTAASLPVELNTQSERQQVGPYKLHGAYFASRIDHSCLKAHRSLVDPDAMHLKWSIPESRANVPDGRYNVSVDFKDVWLLALVNAAIVRNFGSCDPHTQVFGMLSQALGAERVRYSNLTETLRYLTKFAQLRGMISRSRSELDWLSQPVLVGPALTGWNLLFGWLVGQQNVGWSQKDTNILLPAGSSAVQFVKDLVNLGLQIQLTTNPTPVSSVPQRYEARSPRHISARPTSVLSVDQ